MRTLSSGLTGFYKLILPLIPCFVLPIFALTFGRELLVRGGEAGLILLAIVAVPVTASVALTLWFALTLRTVRLEEASGRLSVRNYRRETTVWLRDIESISNARWMRPETIVLKLRRPSELGDSVRFMPADIRALALFSGEHPLAGELRERAGL